jgi:hypothetical protein
VEAKDSNRYTNSSQAHGLAFAQGQDAMTKDELLTLLRPVILDDKPRFDRYLSAYPPVVSELTFTNAFCWAEVRHHLCCEWEGHLLICYRQGDCCLSFYPPIGPAPATVLARRIDGLRDYCWTRLNKELVAGLPPWARPVPDRANSDYVYQTADLRTLAGKAYHAKRNYARRFAELYAPEVRPLAADLISGCLQVQERWLEDQRNNESARDESTALIKALRHFHDLRLQGVGILVGGSVVAFAIGEPLNPTTYVEHFEKALPGYTGAYQFLLQSFAQSVPEGFVYLNREQDLGTDGLRRAKESWRPAFLVEKYAVRIRKHSTARAREPVEGAPFGVRA